RALDRGVPLLPAATPRRTAPGRHNCGLPRRDPCLGAIYAVRPRSGVARGAELGMELGSLVPEQAAGSMAREVPAAPVIVVEPGTLAQQAGRDRAPGGGVEVGIGPQQNRYSVGAERRRIPAVEGTLDGRTRQVSPDDDCVGIEEVQSTEDDEALHQYSEGEAPALPAQRRPTEPRGDAGEVQHEGGRVQADFRKPVCTHV